MRYRFTLLILLLLTTFTAFAQEPDLRKSKNYKDSIKVWVDYCDYLLGYNGAKFEDYPGLAIAGKKGVSLTKPNDNENRSLFLYLTGAGYEFSGVNDTALTYYRMAEKHALKFKDPKRILDIYKQMMWMVEEKEALEIIDKALAIKDTTKNDAIKITIADILYRYYRDRNKYEQALEVSLESLALTKEEKLDKKGGAYINIGVKLTQIGDMYYRMGQRDKAMEYFQKALPYVSNSYMDGAALLYNDMIGVFLDNKQVDSADIYYRKVYHLKKAGHKNKEALSHANRNYAQYYADIGRLDKAMSFAQKAYALSVEDGGDVTMLESNTVMGKVYYKRKEYQNALKHFGAIPVEARDYDKESYNEMLFLKAESYAALGDWQKATEAYRDYAYTKDTLLNEAGKRNIAEMEAKFQNKQKQQQIDEAKKQRVYLIFGIVGLLLILLLLIVNYINKQRSAKILDAKNAALYEANKTKATLFSVISHDLRSPISQLYQYLQLQKDNPALLTEEMKQKHSERIGAATASLLETMEDMLVWSKTQMERFVPAIEHVQVNRLIQDTITLLGPDIDAKSLSVKNKIEENTIVQSDTNLLKIILRNLILNAIQYSTKDSEIEITAEQAESGTTISIKDHGLGMSNEVIALLQKGDQSLSSNKRGLGWSLITEMASSIGATIDIQKNVPKGTVVSLNITNTKA